MESSVAVVAIKLIKLKIVSQGIRIKFTPINQQITLPDLHELLKDFQKEISSNLCYPTHITDKISSCTLVMVDSLVSEINNIYTKLVQSDDVEKCYESHYRKITTNS